MVHQNHALNIKILLLLMLFIIPLNVLSVIASYILISDARDSIEHSIQSTISTYQDEIDTTLKHTDYQLYQLSEYDASWLTLFNATSQDLNYNIAKITLANSLNKQASVSDIADTFFFYRKDFGDLLIVPHNNDIFDNYLMEQNYFSNKQLYERSKWHIAEINDKHYLVRFLLKNNTYYGAFLQLDSILANIEDYLDYPVEEIIYSLEAITETSGWQYYISEKSNYGDLIITLCFDQDIITKNIAYWRWLLIAILFFYIALIPILFYYLKKWLISPLKTLNKAHLQLENGNQVYRISEMANSLEFDKAYLSFNSMAESLQALRLENTNKELARKQMLLTNLQLQIRPHFLLNSFNLLYALIQTHKTEAAQKMILYLSQYFRYLFRYNRDLELFPKEFELIQQYLEVALIQTPDSFTFTYDFDPEINLVRIPPLLLHNFIENIITHALVHGRVIHIMFYGFYENRIVTFQIADDGIGMSKEDVELINSGSMNDYKQGQHLGLRNSITRLSHFYNNQAKVHVESELNKLTMFTITFPYDLEEKEDERHDTFDG